MKPVERPVTPLEDGVAATLRLITSPEVEGINGHYFDGTSESAPHPQAEDPEARRRLLASASDPARATRLAHVLRGGMLSPRGYGPLYGLMLLSHRVLRYTSGFLHLALLATSMALVDEGLLYQVALGAQA